MDVNSNEDLTSLVTEVISLDISPVNLFVAFLSKNPLVETNPSELFFFTY